MLKKLLGINQNDIAISEQLTAINHKKSIASLDKIVRFLKNNHQTNNTVRNDINNLSMLESKNLINNEVIVNNGQLTIIFDDKNKVIKVKNNY